MSKFAKVCLILAGSLLALGFLISITCFFIGGRKIVNNHEYIEETITGMAEKMNINMDNIRWHIDWDDDWNDDWDNDELYVNGINVDARKEHTSIETDGVNKLNLDLGAGKFEIKYKDTDDRTFDLTISGYGECNCEVENDTLIIEGFKDIHTFENSYNKIIIEIPENYQFDSIVAQVGAGVLEITDVQTDDMELDLGAGEIKLNDLSLETLEASIGAGKMEAKRMNVTNSDLSVNMGECRFDGVISGDLTAECNMGNLVMELNDSEDDHNFDITCSAGNIHMDGYNSATLAGGKQINNHADSNYEINCSMGSISLDFDE